MPTLVRNIHRGHAEAFVERLLETRKPATASNRHRGLQQFFNFLVGEGEIDQSPMERMKPLTVPEQPPPVLRETDYRALLAASSGRTFEDRRDTAIIRALIDTGARLSELTNLAYDRTDPDRSDVNLDASQLWVTGRADDRGYCQLG
jgi:site-specific recombinase XerD